MHNLKKTILYSLLIGGAVAPFATIACGSQASPSTGGETIKFDNKDYIVVRKNIFDVSSVKDNYSVGDSNVEAENKTRSVIGRPFSLHGHSDQMLNWTPDLYPDAKFSTPINKTISEKFKGQIYKSTQTRNNAHMTLLDGLNDKTSNTPSAGLEYGENASFSLDFWQYIETLVAWGGAMSEGTWQTPTADWINAAHRNGVKILGTIFFPPDAFGGNRGEVRKIFTKVGDRYPYADNMVKMARTLGFDGWFWNFETSMENSDLDNLADFSNYLGKISKENNIINQFYGSLPTYTDLGNLNWKIMYNEASKSLNYNEYLADYRVESSDESKNFLRQHNIDEHVFSKGIDFEGGGFDISDRLTQMYQNGDRQYYGPNKESMWLFTFKKHADSNEVSREKFWSSSTASRDVRYNYIEDLKSGSSSRSGNFNSMSNLFIENSIVNGKHNFTTSFNRGIGHYLYENGQKVNGIDPSIGYTNLSTQDIMPTYRWMVDVFNSDNKRINGTPYQDNAVSINGTIKEANDQDGAFEGSDYLSYVGNIPSNGKMSNKLFASKKALETSDYFEVTYKGIKPSVQIWFNDGSSQVLTLQDGKDVNSWKVGKVQIPTEIKGKKMMSWGLSYQNTTSSPFDASQIKVGKLSFNVGEVIEKPAIGNILMERSYTPSFQKGINFRLKIDRVSNNQNVKFIKYEINNGTEYNLSAISGAEAVWLKNIDPSLATVINGVKFYKLKATIYGNNNEVLNTQNFLIEA